MKFLKTLTSMALMLLLIINCCQKTEGKFRLRRLLKAGLILGALGSAKIPRILPIPIPIPLRFDKHHSFPGGHYGEYHGYRENPYGHGGYVAPYGHGGYHYGSGGYGTYGSEWW